MKIPTDFLYVLALTKKQSAHPEIIVCEQNPTETEWLSNYCRSNDIKYYWEQDNDSNRGNMGLLKNIGISNATSKYVYFSDTDILLIQADYLERIVNFFERSNQQILVRPPMLRLISGKDELLSISSDILQIDNPLRQCFVKYENGLLVAAGHETYKYINNLPHVQYDSNSWQLVYHSGGIAVNIELLLEVGGYCMDYYGWGLDDIDLQWKLNETFGARALNECIDNTYVLHIEHPSRCNDELYAQNREKFNARRAEGLNESIQKDVMNYDNLSGILLY